jgi:small subunit ribosomal protein S16
VATKIKLMRMGKMRAPYYRIVVADARTKRDGRAIEVVGKYHPKSNPSVIDVDSPRVQYWLSVGAVPTEPVAAILRVTGDWQRFKGLPEPEPMQQAAGRVDKKAVFEAAAKEAMATESSGRKRGGSRASEGAAAETATGESAGAEAAPSESAQAEPASSDAPASEAPGTEAE